MQTIHFGEFLYQNLMIQNNLIHGAYIAGIKIIIFRKFMYIS